MAQTLVTLSYSALRAKYTRLSVIHNGLTHHIVPEEEKEEPRRGHSPHTSGSPPRNIPLRHSRGQLALARLSHPIELLRLLRKTVRTSPIMDLDRHIRNQRSPMLELVKILGESHGFRDPLKPGPEPV